MPSAGRPSATDHQGMVRLQLAPHDGLDLLVHQRFDLVRPRASHDDQAHIVADEMRQRRIVDEHARETLEDLRGRRIVDMGFHLVAALVSHFAHQRMQKTKQVEIMTLLRNRHRKRLYRCHAGVDDDFPGIGDDIDPKRHAGDDEVLPGLPDHAQIAAERGEAADQAAYRDDEAEENTQAHCSEQGNNSFRQRCLHEADIRSLRQLRASLAADSTASFAAKHQPRETFPRWYRQSQAIK